METILSHISQHFSWKPVFAVDDHQSRDTQVANKKGLGHGGISRSQFNVFILPPKAQE